MKILMPAIHYYPVIGGIETWTQNIAEKLAGKAEVLVVTGKVKNQPQKEERRGVKIWRTSLFTLSNLSASPLFYSLSLMPFVFLKSLRLINKEKIELLHCQGFLSSFLGFCLSKLSGVPYVVTVQRLERSSNPLKNFIYRKAAVCIGVSRAVAENFRKIGVKKVEVVSNGLDLKRFENLTKKPHHGFVVITTARLERVKGIEYLIEAFKLLNSQNSKLLIIGDGSERRHLEKLVEKLGLKEEVSFLGAIFNEQVPEYLLAADCFVLPSLKEGFGIAILEAQAVGIPVIGTRVGGILDLVENGKTGLLVEPKNAAEIHRAIAEIQSNPPLAKSLAENAKKNLTKYDWQNIAEKVYEIYLRHTNISA